MSYELWTMHEWFEMDRQIARDIEDYDDARERAESEANDRDRIILITRDGDGSNHDVVYPEEAT